jgi:hypothetical protein
MSRPSSVKSIAVLWRNRRHQTRLLINDEGGMSSEVNDMAWKEDREKTLRYYELPELDEPFQIMDKDEPKPLAEGKEQIVITTKDGYRFSVNTYPKTTDDIIRASQKTGWCTAFTTDDGKYINFRSAGGE